MLAAPVVRPPVTIRRSFEFAETAAAPGCGVACQRALRNARTASRIRTRVAFYSIMRQSLSMSTLAATASASLSIEASRRSS
jgi:hypothetical protein